MTEADKAFLIRLVAIAIAIQQGPVGSMETTIETLADQHVAKIEKYVARS
jgi:hypothetical protein